MANDNDQTNKQPPALNHPAPSEDEMPDPQQVEERVQSGDERRSAEKAFGNQPKTSGR